MSLFSGCFPYFFSLTLVFRSLTMMGLYMNFFFNHPVWDSYTLNLYVDVLRSPQSLFLQVQFFSTSLFLLTFQNSDDRNLSLLSTGTQGSINFFQYTFLLLHRLGQHYCSVLKFWTLLSIPLICC